MAAAVHLVEGIDSPVTANTTSLTTRLTLSAAELAAAGFENNDEALVLFWATLRQANTATEQLYQLTYNGSVITSAAATPRIDSWATSANTGRNVGFMGWLDLATLADLDFDNARAGTSANVTINKARLCCIRLADFGTEGTDWHRNKSTTDVAHTTTYSGTNRAAITFTPPEAGEDWIVLSYAHFAIDSVSVNLEGRVMLDGSTLVAGDYSEEGESTTEERTLVCWGVLENLSADEHTVTFESRDDTATAANNHRESALFIFRASQWPDLFYHLNSNTAMSSGADVQLATVTATLSADQPALIIGNGNMNQDVDTGGWLWVEDGGTPLAPVTDQAAGTTEAVWVACDLTDELNALWLGYTDLTAGAQDLDLMGAQGDGSTGSRTMIGPRLLVWGLEQPAGGADLTEDLADDLGLTDALAREVEAAREPADDLGLTDALARAVEAARTTTDPLGLTDRLVVELTRTADLADDLALTDALARAVEAARELAETLGLTDQVARAISAARTTTDPLGLTDRLVVELATMAELADPLGLTDTPARQLDAVRDLADPLGLTDRVSVVLGIPLDLADPLGLADRLTLELASARASTDPLALHDTLTRAQVSVRNLQDALGLTDTLTVTLVAPRALQDALGLTDRLDVQVGPSPETPPFITPDPVAMVAAATTAGGGRVLMVPDPVGYDSTP